MDVKYSKPLNEFIVDFRNKFPKSTINILEEFKYNKHHYVKVDTEFGICKIRKDHLLKGVIPTINVAVDKNLYFINKVNKIHNNKYDYSLINYTTAHKKVKIICKIHGEFEQEANAHIIGQGCSKCGDFRMSIHNSNNPSGWTKTNWDINSKNSKRFDNFKVYIIKCKNKKEQFYKIGRTFRTVEMRFSGKVQMPYDFEIIKIFTGSSEEMYNLENKLKKENKNNKYLPKLSFRGNKECFKDIKYEN